MPDESVWGVVKQIIDYAINPLYSFVIWVTCLVVLIAPLPDFLRLSLLREEHGGFFGLGFLVGLLLQVSTLGLAYWNERYQRKESLEYLKSLNSREAFLLLTATQKKTQTIAWQPGVDETDSLIHKGLLLDVPGQHLFLNRPFTIPTFVWKELTEPNRISKLKEQNKEA